MLTYPSYAEFKKACLHFGSFRWQQKIHLEAENFTWKNATECLADHEAN